MQALKVLLMAIGLLPILVFAELTVIYDSGNTQPIAPFLEVFEAPDAPPPRLTMPQPPLLGAADLANLLPIRSPGLTPGRVTPRNQDRPFASS